MPPATSASDAPSVPIPTTETETTAINRPPRPRQTHHSPPPPSGEGRTIRFRDNIRAEPIVRREHHPSEHQRTSEAITTDNITEVVRLLIRVANEAINSIISATTASLATWSAISRTLTSLLAGHLGEQRG
ncbi:unnamed protein product, partial [Iphiclides podalirius]